MPPSSTRTYTLFPYTTLFLSGLRGRRRAGLHALHGVGRGYAPDAVMSKSPRGAAWLAKPVSRLNPMRADRAHRPAGTVQIGRAHVSTPVPNAHLVCRLLLEQKKKYI